MASHLWVSGTSVIRASVAADFAPNFRIRQPRCTFSVTSFPMVDTRIFTE